MRNVQASHARAQLLKLLDQVEAGESLTISRRGRVVAQLVPARPEPPKQPKKVPRRKRRGMSEEEILAAANAVRARMG